VHILGGTDLNAPRNLYVPSTTKTQLDLGLRTTIGLEDVDLWQKHIRPTSCHPYQNSTHEIRLYGE
jgi:hypothetical protein